MAFGKLGTGEVGAARGRLRGKKDAHWLPWLVLTCVQCILAYLVGIILYTAIGVALLARAGDAAPGGLGGYAHQLSVSGLEVLKEIARSLWGVPNDLFASNPMVVAQVNSRFQHHNTFALHLMVCLAMVLPFSFWSGSEGFVRRSLVLPLLVLPVTVGLTGSYILGFSPYARFSVITIIALQLVAAYLVAHAGRWVFSSRLEQAAD